PTNVLPIHRQVNRRPTGGQPAGHPEWILYGTLRTVASICRILPSMILNDSKIRKLNGLLNCPAGRTSFGLPNGTASRLPRWSREHSMQRYTRMLLERERAGLTGQPQYIDTRPLANPICSSPSVRTFAMKRESGEGP